MRAWKAVGGHGAAILRGCLLIAALLGASRAAAGQAEAQAPSPAGGAESAGGESDEVIRGPRIEMSYQTGPATDVTEAEVWATPDEGRTWRLLERFSRPTSPLRVDSPGDGRHGLFLILRNEAGASAAEPSPGTPPHRWVRVDRQSPRVQLLQLEPDRGFAVNREIHLRWRAEDENLRARPVSLHYRTEQTRSFRAIAGDLGAVSSHRWTVPVGVSGRVDVKISAVDRAGRRGEYVADSLVIEGDTARLSGRGPTTMPFRAEGTGPARGLAAGGTSPGSPSEASAAPTPAAYNEPDAGTGVETGPSSEAQRRFEQATWHRLRGEEEAAVARYREALALDSGLRAARNDLAGLLFLRGDLPGAEAQYRRVLREEESNRTALGGLALVQTKRRQYRSAEATLQKLLLVEPANGENWLHLGDVLMFMGRRADAREAWSRAAGLAGAPPEVRTRAEKRLEMYPAQRAVEVEQSP
jgi:hypothetical protein